MILSVNHLCFAGSAIVTMHSLLSAPLLLLSAAALAQNNDVARPKMVASFTNYEHGIAGDIYIVDKKHFFINVRR